MYRPFQIHLLVASLVQLGIYFILFYCIVFYFIVIYCILLYFIVFYFILFYFILFYFILFYFSSQNRRKTYSFRDSTDMYKAITERQKNLRRVLERKRFLTLPLLYEQGTNKLIPNLVSLVNSDLVSLTCRNFHDLI